MARSVTGSSAPFADGAVSRRRQHRCSQAPGRAEDPVEARVAVRVVLIFIALTAPVAPACSVRPRARRRMPGISSARVPSIRIKAPEEIGRRAHGRAQRPADGARPQLVAPRLRRLHADEPRWHRDVANHHHADDDSERESEPRTSPTRNDCRRQREQHANDSSGNQDHRPMTPSSCHRWTDLGVTRSRDRKCKYRIEEEARCGDCHDQQADRDQDRTAQDVKGFAVQYVQLDVEHRQPNPHRREDLDKGQPPVRDE
jgi:hypothetical protein